MIEDELWLVFGIILLIIIIIVVYLVFSSGKVWEIIKNIKIPKPWSGKS
ncbi:MAG: DUF350 domain-containing protein [Candidatus Aenigmatarchaeota archaeon]